MNIFLRAILNEWKQQWRLLLILFAANVFFLVWIIFLGMCRYWYETEIYTRSFCLILVICCCYIPVVMAPNLLADSPPAKSWTFGWNFIIGLIVRWYFVVTGLLALVVYYIWQTITDKYQWWGISPVIVLSCFILIMLFCVAVARRLRRFAPVPLPSCSPGMLYWVRFVAGLIPFLIFTILAFVIGTVRPEYLIYLESNIFLWGAGSGLYALVFFIAVMMPKTSRTIVLGVAVLTTLLLFILLVPGIMGGIALFGTDAFIQKILWEMTRFSFKRNFEGFIGYLVGFATVAFMGPCIIVLPLSGYYLWTRRIMAGKRYLLILFLGIGLLISASIVLWIIAGNIGQSKLHHSKLDAQAVGLLNKSGQILMPDLTPVSAERNAASLYYKAFKMLDELNEKYRSCSYRSYYINSPPHVLNGVVLTLEETNQELIDFIKSPEREPILVLLEQAATYPECRFAPRIKHETINLFADEMESLAGFILVHAYIYKHNGQLDKILPEIEKSFRLAEIIWNEQLWYSFTRSWMITENAITDAIRIGPENSASIVSYRKMLDHLTQLQINYLDNSLEGRYDYFSRMLTFQCTFDNDQWGYYGCTYFNKYLLWADLLAGYPLVRRYFADYIDTSVKVRREMLEIRKMPVLPSELSRLLDDYSSVIDYSRLLRRNLSLLFKSRAEQAMLKIGLALKIYKCEHGKYPASLQELVPAILPEIPVDPLDGKPFGYTVKDGNFTLTRNAKWQKELSSELKPTN